MNLIKGMKVRIDKICESTQYRCGLVREMKALRGTTQTITWSNGLIGTISAGSWSWSVNDLHPLEIPVPKSKKVEYFNIKNLF